MIIKKKREASTSKEDGDFAKSLEDELLKYTTNYEEMNVEAQHSDTTECSSSFDDSDCEAEGGVDTLPDSEVLSDFCGAAESASSLHGSGDLFASRKKLSSHWRSFVHPLMWRCKWVELQIKKLEAQAREYDRKLERYNMVQFENNARSEVLCRKKRRRTEATSDIAAYMSGHNLFSYYEHRRNIGEIAHNVVKIPGSGEEIKSDAELGNEEAGDCDKFLEDIFRKIEVVQSRVHKMKRRVEDLGVNLCSSSADYLRSPSPPTPTHRMPVGNYIASQLLAEYNLGAALLPTHGEAAAPQQSHLHSHVAYDFENEDKDDVLIDNHRVREELRYFEEVKIHSIKRPWLLKDGFGSTSRLEPQPRSASNLTNVPKTKRRKTS